MNLFDWNLPPLKITKPIRLIELFAGIGAQAKALERIGVSFEHYRICEFDRYAVASYNAIRKYTPRECWRLMDFGDTDYDKAAAVNSKSQLYKQAGNSIVVNCLVAIFGRMFDGKENVYKNA